MIATAVRYGYDLAGHRVGSSGDLSEAVDVPEPVEDAAHGPANELTSWNGAELVYDEAGNLVDDGTSTYTWDARGQLGAVNGAANAEFAYDPFGRRPKVPQRGEPLPEPPPSRERPHPGSTNQAGPPPPG